MTIPITGVDKIQKLINGVIILRNNNKLQKHGEAKFLSRKELKIIHGEGEEMMKTKDLTPGDVEILQILIISKKNKEQIREVEVTTEVTTEKTHNNDIADVNQHTLAHPTLLEYVAKGDSHTTDQE